MVTVLGEMKGAAMKLGQLASFIDTEFLPPEYAEELRQLQSNAPSMGWPFVKRRMRSELGADWQKRFKSFQRDAAAAASRTPISAAKGG